MTTLTEFLLARIAEDEAVARRMVDALWPQEVAVVASPLKEPAPEGEPRGSVAIGPSYSTKAYARIWSPLDPTATDGIEVDNGWGYHATADVIWSEGVGKRLLAECEAKRRIVEYQAALWRSSADAAPILRLIALPYADHQDYRSEWAL